MLALNIIGDDTRCQDNVPDPLYPNGKGAKDISTKHLRKEPWELSKKPQGRFDTNNDMFKMTKQEFQNFW